MTFYLVLGGVKSGKTRFAMGLANKLSSTPLYIATSRLWDDDHRQRVLRHRRERPACFETVECETDLSSVPCESRTAVIDCVTLWLANYSSDEDGDTDRCLERVRGELTALERKSALLIFVSNELGQGVHPETRLGRRFVDLQGMVNQEIAARSARVWIMHAGIAVPIKGVDAEAPQHSP